MRALCFEAGRAELRHDLPAIAAVPGEVRVRVLSAGVCATDLALRRGYMGFAGVPGHEFVGEALTGPLRGARVVGEINAACGHCVQCAQGLGRHCAERTVLGILGRAGAFADELSLPAGNLFVVPEGVATHAAVFVEPLAAAFEIAEQVELHPKQRALIVGDGRLGILCAHVLALHGLSPVVAGRHPERAGLLPAGATHECGMFEPGATPPRVAFDLAVEATGDPEVLQRVLGAVRPRGEVVLKTTSERPAPLDLSLAVVNEVRITGSRCGPFPPALRALEESAIPVEALISERYALDDGLRALGRAAEPGVLKILIDVA